MSTLRNLIGLFFIVSLVGLVAVPVMAAPSSFSLTNSGGITIPQGSSGSNTITVTLVSGQAQPVTLSCDGGVPAGAVCSFSPSTGSPTFSSQLTIITQPTTVTGAYTINVAGTSGGQKQSTQFLLTVTSPGPVGGSQLPVNKLALVAPFIGLAALVLGSIGVVVTYLNRRIVKGKLPDPIAP